jgi:gas vesicle protein
MTAADVLALLKAWQQTQKPPRPLPRGPDPFVIGFTLGMIAGGVAAGLWTPRSGKHLREQIHDQGLRFKDTTENIALQAKTTAQEVLHRHSTNS